MCARFRPTPNSDDPSALWVPDPETLAIWQELTPGTPVRVIKRAFDGTEAARYPAVVADDEAHGPWRTLIATWVLPTTTQGSLTFVPGDILHERFSPEHPYDTFGVCNAAGTFKGWYANVTWPALLERTNDGLELTWQDLFLDLVITADAVALLDEDELDTSTLASHHPRLTDAIRVIAQRLHHLAEDGLPPFTPPTAAPSR